MTPATASAMLGVQSDRRDLPRVMPVNATEARRIMRQIPEYSLHPDTVDACQAMIATDNARLGGGLPNPDRIIEAKRDDGEPSDGVIAARVISVMLGTIISVVAALWIGSAIASALIRPAGCEALTAHECTALMEARQ